MNLVKTSVLFTSYLEMYDGDEEKAMADFHQKIRDHFDEHTIREVLYRDDICERTKHCIRAIRLIDFMGGNKDQRKIYTKKLLELMDKVEDEDLRKIVDEFGENEIALAFSELTSVGLFDGDTLQEQLLCKYTRHIVINHGLCIADYLRYESPEIVELDPDVATEVIPADWSHSLKTVLSTGIVAHCRIESVFPKIEILTNVTVAKTSMVPNLIFAHNVVFEECDAPLRKLKYASRWDFPDRLDCIPKLEVTLQEGLDLTQLPKIVYEPSMPRHVDQYPDNALVADADLPVVGYVMPHIIGAISNAMKKPYVFYGCVMTYNPASLPNSKFHYCVHDGKLLHSASR